MRGAIVAVVVAGLIGCAFLARVTAYAGVLDGPDAPAGAPRRGARPPAATATSAASAAGTTTSAAATSSPALPAAPRAVPAAAARVLPGVLARAVSRRAQEREATAPAHRERHRGEVVSIEIEWHAPGTP